MTALNRIRLCDSAAKQAAFYFSSYGIVAFVVRGAGVVRGKPDILIQQNTIIWIPPGVHETIFYETGSLVIEHVVGSIKKNASATTTIFRSNGIYPQPLSHLLDIENGMILPGESKDFTQFVDSCFSAAGLDLCKNCCIVIPRHRILQKITNSLLTNPGDLRTLPQWAQIVGATPRTIMRIFEQHTWMSYSEWKMRNIVIHAHKMLQDNQPVGSISTALGYGSPSAFIYAFKRTTGSTPKRYLEKLG